MLQAVQQRNKLAKKLLEKNGNFEPETVEYPPPQNLFVSLKLVWQANNSTFMRVSCHES